jgi:hypothetical protein
MNLMQRLYFDAIESGHCSRKPLTREELALVNDDRNLGECLNTVIKGSAINIWFGHYSLVAIRKDLIEKGLGVPVGDAYYYYDASPLPARWINEYSDSDNEQFQVFLNGQWLEANSIDFEWL